MSTKGVRVWPTKGKKQKTDEVRQGPAPRKQDGSPCKAGGAGGRGGADESHFPAKSAQGLIRV